MNKKYLATFIFILIITVNASGSIVNTKHETRISTIYFEKNILYVGGSGPDNYTQIQDAIND